MDDDRDGVFGLQLGEISAAGMQVEVVLRWDAIKRRWTGPDPAPGQPYVIMRDRESELDAMARAGWTAIVTKLAAAAPPQQALDPWDTDGISADEVSHSYRYISLAGRSDAELLDFMVANRDLNDVVHERAQQLAANPNFWSVEPRPNALATIHANRPVNVRDREAFVLDLNDGRQAPEKGDLTLDDGPSGCFAPSGAFVQQLHCEPAGSFLLLASSLMPWDGIAATDRRTVFNFRKIAVQYEDARQFLQTVWFMLRARTIPTASHPSDDQGGGSTDDGRATLLLTAPGESTIVSGTRFAPQAGLAAGLSGDGNGLDQTALLNIVVRLFDQEWSVRLGDQWTPKYPDIGPAYNEPPPKPSDDEVAAIHEMAAEFLRLYFASQASPAFAEQAISAAMELGFDDLRGVIAKVSDHLPPPTDTEIAVARIDAEIKPWVEKYGEALAGESASGRRTSASGITIEPLPSDGSPGLPQLPGLNDSTEGPDSKSAAGEVGVPDEDQIFAPLDALYERRFDLRYMRMTAPERLVMDLRTAAPLAVRYFEARNDPKVLSDLLIENTALVDIGLPRLASLDPDAAVAVLRATRKEELKFRFRPEGLAMEKLGAGPDPTPEETRFKGIIEGREPLTRENIRVALSPPLNDLTIWDDYAHALALAVPPTEPQRYAFSEVEQELDRLMAEAQAGKNHVPAETIALACARREIPEAWEKIENLGERMNMWQTWRALGLLARADVDEGWCRFYGRVWTNLSETKGALDEMFFATWLADVRELKPKLEKIATSGPADAEGLMSSSQSSNVDPVRQRFHEARRVVSIWNEEDPATRSRLLIGFALRRPDHFDPETQPEAWHLFHDQLLSALSPLDATARAGVREFFDFARREIQQRRKWFGHDPKQDVPFYRALGQMLK
ncbi:MAG: hypothetical protein ABI680_10910 [Chthoniobacteraceae bacterium]